MSKSCANRISGMSLMEMLCVILILSIPTIFIVKNVSAAAAAAHTQTAFLELIGATIRARTVATAQEHDVILCPSSDGKNCADDSHWEIGWIAFVDKGGENLNSEQSLFLKQGALKSGIHIVSSISRIRFQAMGGVYGKVAKFTVCDSRGVKAASEYEMMDPGNILDAIEPVSADVEAACSSL